VYGTIEGDAIGSTNQVELTLQMALSQPVPLPPLAEQYRIVAKVNELMALCDQLEAAQMEQDIQRDALRIVSLHRLTSQDDDAERSADVRFFLDKAPRLTTKPEHVAMVRQAILDLATQGRLVPQEPGDEPISDRALAHKPMPTRQATGRAGGSLASPTDDTVPWSIPESWRWARMYQLCERDAPIVYGILQPGPDVKPHGVPYIRPAEIRHGRIQLNAVRHAAAEIAKQYSRSVIATGDIILTIVGTVGATAFVPAELDGANITQSACRLRVDEVLVIGRYLDMVLHSACAQNQLDAMMFGTAVRRVNIGHVRAIAVPLPPLAEQHRIVAKVDELMALCDELEAALGSAQSERGRLLEALLHDALEGTGVPILVGSSSA